MIEKIDTAIMYAVGCVVVLTATFFLGYSCSANKYKLEIEKIKSTSFAEQSKALENKATIEKNNYEIIKNAQSRIFNQTDDIQKSYFVLSNTDVFGNDSLHNSDNPNSNTDMSNSTEPSSAVQNCRCECPTNYRARLQRLYQRQLEVARDCDITATHYNELINIYKEIKE